MKVFAWITALLLLATAAAFFYLRDRNGETEGQTSSPAPALASDRAETFPPAVTDTRPPLVADGTPVELCGYGQILTGAGTYPYPASVQASARLLLERVAHDLATSDDPGRRAVAVYYRTIDRRATDAAACLARNPMCEKDPVCRGYFYGQGLREMRAAADQLATSVATTRDGRAYATA